MTPSAEVISSRRFGGWSISLPTTAEGDHGLEQRGGHRSLGNGLAGDSAGGLEQPAQGRDLATEHIGLAGLPTVEGEQDAVGGVLDVDHVHPQLGKRDRRHLAGQELLDLLADRGVVLGTVDAARLHDHAGQAILDQLLGDLMGLVLGLLVVGGEADAGVLVGLVDDLAGGVAEGGDRRDVDDPRGLRIERRPQDALCAEHVRLVHPPMLAAGIPTS